MDLINDDDEPKSINLPTGSGQGAIEFRLNKSHTDLNQPTRKEIATNPMYFSNLNMKTFYRRSTSATRNAQTDISLFE